MRRKGSNQIILGSLPADDGIDGETLMILEEKDIFKLIQSVGATRKLIVKRCAIQANMKVNIDPFPFPGGKFHSNHPKLGTSLTDSYLVILASGLQV